MKLSSYSSPKAAFGQLVAIGKEVAEDAETSNRIISYKDSSSKGIYKGDLFFVNGKDLFYRERYIATPSHYYVLTATFGGSESALQQNAENFLNSFKIVTQLCGGLKGKFVKPLLKKVRKPTDPPEPPEPRSFNTNPSSRDSNLRPEFIEDQPVEHKREKPTATSNFVLNGIAINKPQPDYPPNAKAVRASGVVIVRVIIDEKGKVTSAVAVSGHPLLRQAAVKAAYQARLSPTMQSGKFIKVTGLLTYNFRLD